jgi:hypothetical protein
MRLALIGLVVAVAFAIGAPLYTVHELTDGEPAEMFDFRPPQTADQLVAVTLSLAFVDAVRRDDATAACRLAADEAVRVLRCARAHPRAVKCGSNRVYDVEQERDDVVAVLVGTCRLEVSARRVAAWEQAAGLA